MGRPLKALFRILILAAVILTIWFYTGIMDKSQDKVLIKEDHLAEMDQSTVNHPDDNTSSKPVSERPKQGVSLLIGKDLSEVEKELGAPQRIDETMYGYQWYIYNLDYKRYMQVGIANNKVVTLYAIGENLDVAPFEIGQSVEEIFNTQYIDTNLNIELNGNTYRFELNDTDLNLRPIVQLGNVYVQLYIDKFTGSLSGVRFLDAETLIKQRPYELVYSGDLIEAQAPSEESWQEIEIGAEQEIFDITNVLRVRYNVKPVKWDETTAAVAYGHSQDMAENNDFSHTSKKFGSLNDRLNKEKVDYQTAGENIAANYTDGPASVEGWLNSKGHRETLLNKDFTHLGVGVFKKYYTQNFIQKGE
ncbi:CAP domain-containing protein [Neobacillus dielmonensis]|uniref:CAP domain-containing protein n=1 Tax=Neobacillus dielmonensis TaxID=1347369 RepID=UPI001F32D26C|nr:CAP domain-containing protein [Neobacillus dielmonensis]